MHSKNIYLVYFMGFIDLFAVSMLVPLLVSYIKSLGASPSVAGIISSIYAFIQFFSGPVMGRYSDILGRKICMQLCFFMSFISYLIMASTSNLFIIFLSRIPLGLFKHTHSLSKAYIADFYSSKKRTEILGKFNSVTNMGFIFGPLFGSYILNRYDFSETRGHGIDHLAFITAVAFFINFVLTTLFLDQVTGTRQYTRKQPKQTYLKIFQSYLSLMSKKNLDCEWIAWINSYRAGGKEVKGNHDLKSCLKECASLEECVGFDYVGGRAMLQNCWLHDSSNPYDATYDTVPGILHYEKLCSLRKDKTLRSAPQNCEWRKRKNTQGSHGLMMQGVSTKIACKKACEISKNCAGFNWNANEIDNFEKCFLTTKISSTKSVSGISHFIRKCGKNAFMKHFNILTTDCEWQVYKGRYSSSGKTKKHIKSLKECMKACYNTPSCASFDWSSIQSTCNFSPSQETSEQYGIDHYNYICKPVW